MKTTHKFLSVFLVLTAVFSALAAAFTAFKLNDIKQTSNKAVSQIVANVREKYPQISDDEIARIINGRAEDKDVDSLLKSYGIDVDSEWIVYENESESLKFIVLSSALCAVFCLSLTAVFLICSAKQKKQTAEITACIHRINNGDYDLSVKGNTEDELSALKSEIYTTTVMLREQSENSLADKIKLKNSLSDISHQLKTPLSSIMVMLETVLDNEDMPGEIRRDFLNDIKRETNNMSFLVQSILTLSKLDANSITFSNKTENLLEIIRTVIRSTAVLAEIKNVSVTARCDESYLLECDSKWLSEALVNIVKNCIEHTQSGGTVSIEVSQNRLYTKITVADNGDGISNEDLPHIFERFYRGRNSSDDSVGIGLSLAKTIIEKGGGYITADSQEGKGSKFTVKYLTHTEPS